MTISYRWKNGRVEKRIVHSSNSPRFRGEPPPVPFHQNLLNAHYSLECEHGSRYRSAYPKTVTKRVLEGAMARGNL